MLSRTNYWMVPWSGRSKSGNKYFIDLGIFFLSLLVRISNFPNLTNAGKCVHVHVWQCDTHAIEVSFRMCYNFIFVFVTLNNFKGAKNAWFIVKKEEKMKTNSNLSIITIVTQGFYNYQNSGIRNHSILFFFSFFSFGRLSKTSFSIISFVSIRF